MEREEAKRARQAEDSQRFIYFIFVLPIFMYRVINDCKCEDSSDGAFVVWLKKKKINTKLELDMSKITQKDWGKVSF